MELCKALEKLKGKIQNSLMKIKGLGLEILKIKEN